eukprot:scaffold12186_cov61-Cyclotella_meneghiniana.AAC.1
MRLTLPARFFASLAHIQQQSQDESNMTLASIEEIVVTQVCPIIGAILSNLAFAAPITSLKSAVKIGSLGSLNPTPWAFMLGNTLGWIAYAFITGNIYVFMANVFGLIFSIYLNIGAMKLQYYDEVRKIKPLIQLAVAEESRPEGSGVDAEASPIDDGEVNNTDVNEGMRSFTSHEIKVKKNDTIPTWEVKYEGKFESPQSTIPSES